MKCPKCGANINPAALLGSKGGKTKGKSKARSSKQARAAVMARWKAYRAKKGKS